MNNVQHLTCVFKLRNPSAWRHAVLDSGFTGYTLALRDLLDWSQANLTYIRECGNQWIDRKTGEVREGSYKADTIAALLPRPEGINSLKDALIKNTGKMLASYLELDESDKQEAGYPTSRDLAPDAYPNALSEFVEMYLSNTVNITKTQAEKAENDARAKLLKLSRGSFMPIEFCRYRDCKILMNIGQKTFYAWMKVADKIEGLSRQGPIRDLVDVNTGETLKMNSQVCVLFPLEMGQRDWHYDQFMKAVFSGRADVKTSKLVKENGDYFLHTSFAFNCPEQYEPESYLGIDRGVFFTMAYGIVDTFGDILSMGHEEDGFRDERIRAGKRIQKRQRQGRSVTVRDYRGRRLDEILHILVNRMIERALENRSMIVLEDLHIQIRGKFYKSAWVKLHKILEYKCRLAGVPFRKGGVWAAYTSQICIYCGTLNKGRRRDGSPFECPACSTTYHSDEGAGINIARRVLYKKKDWGGVNGKAGDYFAFHRSFANGSSFETEVDLRKEYDIAQQYSFL